MKNKSKNHFLRKIRQFRFHASSIKTQDGKLKKLHHPAYAFIEKGNIYVYVSITHSKKVDGAIVIKLRKNPNPNDIRDSFYIDEIKEDSKDRFGRKRDKWKMDEQDDFEIREKYKKR